MKYRFITPSVVQALYDDGTSACIPLSDGNPDFEVYKAWLAEGNVPDPALPPDLSGPVWDEFRVRRDLYLSRLSDIAGRFYRRGDSVVPAAADAIAQGLLDMPTDPALLALTPPDALRAGIVAAANQLLKAQLVFPDGTPRPDGPAIKAALDKVFKQP